MTSEDVEPNQADGGAAGERPNGGDLAGQRMVEALLFASPEPLSLEELTLRVPDGTDVLQLLEDLERHYAPRGVNLVKLAGKWCFRTAEDLAYLMHRNVEEQRKLSRAALETLAIIAYHQPVTRAEIEEIRGVSTSKGTLDVLLETTWIRMRGRRRTPGRPVTYGTTEQFLVHFGLENVKDLPGLEELKGAGLLDSAVPATFVVPIPNDEVALTEDEDPLEDGSFFDDDAEETAGA
ncbi:SMC-Scp complex subunit ScpB [uncultured Roseibium sp.]|uniref:SMC-Scp complex subunit ScpB n=1 Tax=uncultured Roseibium sp. TaxID=1936171 RepID=UPI0026029DBD|nr:SMC-Scp complex subunit ScpB [uncultured Roseibium sp.]